MILRYQLLSQHPRVFQSLTGLRLPEFEELFQEVLPLHNQAYLQHLEAQRQQRRQAPRVRAVGGGPAFTLEARDQVLLVIVWLLSIPPTRCWPTSLAPVTRVYRVWSSEYCPSWNRVGATP